MLDDKVERREVETMISTKASKDDITELLPDMRLYEEKVTSQIEESIEDLQVKLDEKLMGWDKRMIAIRNEFDMGNLRKFIDTKANKEVIANDF